MKAETTIPPQGAQNMAFLRDMAGKYIWWKTPEEALEFPTRIIAQAMNRGNFRDITAVVDEFGEDYLREIVKNAEAGQFNERSWHYWHYRLGLASEGQVPALPVRNIP